jgi:hypothetical protein
MARRHVWEEDGETFSVEETGGGRPEGVSAIVLDGPRFPHTFPDSGEAPLAREILRLAHELRVEQLRGNAAERQRDDKAEEIRCLRAEREGLLKPPAPCIWTEDENGDWASACGNAYVFYSGGPRDNAFVFCCFCGHPLVEEPWEESRDGGDDDNLTDVEADAMTLEGVYGPEDS